MLVNITEDNTKINIAPVLVRRKQEVNWKDRFYSELDKEKIDNYFLLLCDQDVPKRA